MKFCTKCGRQLFDDAAFCAGCGTRQADAATVTPKAVEAVPPHDRKQEALIRRRPVLGILLILAGVAIIVAVILAAMAQY